MMLPLVIFGIAAASFAISARWHWWRMPKEGIPVLMYHKVGHPLPGCTMPNLWVTPARFRQQMSYLRKRDYEPIVFSDLHTILDGTASPPRRPILITFDDGYRNTFTDAFPILDEFGFPATIYVVVEAVGRRKCWRSTDSEIPLEMISWEQLKGLQTAGWDIGSHSMTHPRLSTLSPEQVEAEMEGSRLVLDKFLEVAPTAFSYPYGAGADDAHIRALAQKCGYRTAVGTHPGKLSLSGMRGRSYNVPRVYVRRDSTIFDFHLQITRGRSRF